MLPCRIDDLNDDELPTIDSGRGIKSLQAYYKKIAKNRGWDDESAKDTMLLLTEEVGELARAIRKSEGLRRDHKYRVNLEEELSDIQLYLLHLANIVNVDLGDAVTRKEMKNAERFNSK